MNLLFCCYSAKLKEHLHSLGFRYEVCGLNPNSKKMFWAYMRSVELDMVLSEWSHVNK